MLLQGSSGDDGFPVHAVAGEAVGVEAVHGRGVDELGDQARQEAREGRAQRLPVLEDVAPVALVVQCALAVAVAHADREAVPGPAGVAVAPAEVQRQVLVAQPREVGVAGGAARRRAAPATGERRRQRREPVAAGASATARVAHAQEARRSRRRARRGSAQKTPPRMLLNSTLAKWCVQDCAARRSAGGRRRCRRCGAGSRRPAAGRRRAGADEVGPPSRRRSAQRGDLHVVAAGVGDQVPAARPAPGPRSSVEADQVVAAARRSGRVAGDGSAALAEGGRRPRATGGRGTSPGRSTRRCWPAGPRAPRRGR